MCNRVTFLESFHHRGVLSVDRRRFLANCGKLWTCNYAPGSTWSSSSGSQTAKRHIMTQSGSPGTKISYPIMCHVDNNHARLLTEMSKYSPSSCHYAHAETHGSQDSRMAFTTCMMAFTSVLGTLFLTALSTLAFTPSSPASSVAERPLCRSAPSDRFHNPIFPVSYLPTSLVS